MDKHFYRSDSGSDSSCEFYDNPFFVEDDKFEREFENTLALFDALLIGEDSQSDTFSLGSSPGSTLKKFEPLKVDVLTNQIGKRKSATLSRFSSYGEEGHGERPQSFLYDEVTEFNRLLKELSDTPLMSGCCSSSSCRSLKTCDHHHHQQQQQQQQRQQPRHYHNPAIVLSDGPGLSSETGNETEKSAQRGPGKPQDLIVNEDECFEGHLPEESATDLAPSTVQRFDSSKEEEEEEEEEMFRSPSLCRDCVRRSSCLNILETDFFESLKSILPEHSVPSTADFRSLPGRARGDRGGFGPDNRRSNWGLTSCTGPRCGLRISREKEESDSAYQTGSSDTLKSSTVSLDVPNTTTPDDREPPSTPTVNERLSRFNENKSGLYVEKLEGKENAFQGTIRVHLNLTHPISIRLGPPEENSSARLPRHGGRLGKHPSSLCDLNSVSCGEEDNVVEGSTGSSLPRSLLFRRADRYASFHLPPDISKVIHVMSDSTTTTVIKVLLNKFQIVDDSCRFALYLRTYDRPANECTCTSCTSNNNNSSSNHIDDNNSNRGSLSSLSSSRPLTCHMRRLTDEERPLDILMAAVEATGVEALERIHFVLQEYSAGEIIWDAFSVPELNNFLTILDIEERTKLEQLERRYAEAKAALCSRIEELQGSTAFKRP